MRIDIQSIGFISKQELKNFVYEKVKTLARFYREVIGSEIFMRIDNSNTKVSKVCQIRVAIPGNDLMARAQCRTFEEATTKVVDALKRQIKNLKAKTINKRKNVIGIKNFYND